MESGAATDGTVHAAEGETMGEKRGEEELLRNNGKYCCFRGDRPLRFPESSLVSWEPSLEV